MPTSNFKEAGTVLSPSLAIGKASASENDAIAGEWELYSKIRVADKGVPSPLEFFLKHGVEEQA